MFRWIHAFLNAVVRSLGLIPESVEYSVNCVGGEESAVPDEVTLDGDLEPANSRAEKTGMLDLPRNETWTGFIELPPGSCLMQLRGRDDDGEVICTAELPFDVVADRTTQVVVPLSCSSAGLMCTPGSDPGVSTTISCRNAVLDCTGDGTPDASCTISADTPGARIEVDNTIVADFWIGDTLPYRNHSISLASCGKDRNTA